MYQRFSFPDTGRGGFATRRGRGGQNRYPNHKRKEAEGLDIEKHPLGELLKSFSGTDLEQLLDDTVDAPQIEDCKYITSYNWTANSKATIIVPGKPPRWTPLTEPQRLKEDTGSYFRDPNAARSPDYPTAPAVCTILNQYPTFPTCDVDIFACGSTLGNLLRFVRSVDRAFRFNVERIGNTVFFVRKENDPRELIKGVHGYGHTFPEAYTTWGKDFKGSEDNQRIVQYKFSDLNCIVRFECDGYVEEHGRQQPDTTFKKDDLLEDLEATSVSPAAPHSKTVENNYHGLSIKTGGAAKVPQSSIFDLKTRSNRWGREIDMSDIIPTLWIKQVPTFIIAYHDGRGLFENKNIKVKDVRADVRKWEQENKQAIRRLSVLLWKIVEIARTNNRGLLEVCRSSMDCIEIRDQYGEGVHALPVSLMEEWASERNNGIVLGKEDDIDQPETHSAPFFAEKWDDDDKDYTACSTDCAYCGKCTY